ncbi:MAG: hypothetical protein IPM47_10030 [Sphingobacteriales bacterium]|nr:MAG: hypothetical protein IPM47_10030 [Sphingobacteriales bacterium]
MKNLSLFFLVKIFGFFLISISVQAQISTPNNNEYQVTTTPSITVGLCPKPDLRVTAFTARHVTKGEIFGEGSHQIRYYYINYRATIKNAGSVASEKCNLDQQFSPHNQNNFTSGGNCLSFAPLAGNSSRDVDGVITVIVPVSHTAVKLRLHIDAACGEQLPLYLKVNECIENNNFSAIVTQSLL